MEIQNGENKIRKVLFNEITFVIAVISVIFGAYMFLTGTPQQNRNDINILQTLFAEHGKVQAETMATIHNGLNSNAKEMKEIALQITELKISIQELKTIINERIPKK